MLLVAIVTGAKADTTFKCKLNGEVVQERNDGESGDFFTFSFSSGSYNWKGSSDVAGCTYDGVNYTGALKFDSKPTLSFTTTEAATIIVVQSTSKNSSKAPKLDNTAMSSYTSITGANVWTATNVAAGTHNVKYNSEIWIHCVYVIYPGPAKAYTVTAATNNSAYGTASTSASSLDKGETATITATPKPGYKFDSWAVEPEGSTLSSTTTNPTTLTMGTANTTVTATFSIATLNITHNEASNGTYTISVAGGEATDANTTATIGQTITLAGTPAVPSFTEVVWNVKDANNNDVTVTDNQFTMPGSSVTISPVFSKPYFVKVAVTGAKTADVTPTGIANDDINCQDNTKLGADGHYVGFTFTGENTLKAGDIVEVKLSQGANGTFVFYKEKEGTNEILTTDVVATAGTHRFVMPAEADGETSLYLVRKSSSFNPYVTYVAIIRPDATVTLNASGFATYSKATDFEFAGAKAYKMNLNYTGGTLQGTEVTGKIKAGEGVLFKGEAGAKVSIIETTGASVLADNSLVGTTPATGDDAPTPDYNNYQYFVLKGKSFVPYTTAATFGAGKAFFQVDKDAQAPASFELVFDGEATAVEAIAEAKANTAAPVKVIKNGKLYIGNYNVAGQQIK